MAVFLGAMDRFTLRLNAPLACAVCLHAVDSHVTAALRTFLLASVAYPIGFPRTTTRRGLVHAIETADPEGLSIPHMLHIEVCVFLEQLDSRAFVRENFIRTTIVHPSLVVLLLLTSVAIHADIDLTLRRAHIAFVTAGCGMRPMKAMAVPPSAVSISTRVAMAF